MFKILGSDGKQYGPVPVEQLRQWIREGRAGGSTQVQAEGATEWQPLHARPEFADVFQPAPPRAERGPGSLPLVVRIFAITTLALGVISLLRLAGNVFTLMQIANQGTHPGIFSLTSLLFQSLAVIGVVIRFISGTGLLFGREWARQLAMYYAAFAVVFGIYGLGRTFVWMSHSGASVSYLASFSFVFNTGFAILLLCFNLATVVLLSRRPVRAAFARE